MRTDGSRNVSLVRGIHKVRPDVPTGLLVYVASLLFSATLTASALILAGEKVTEPVTVGLLAVASAAAERWRVRLSATHELTVYLLPTLFAAVVLGPLEAGIVAACSNLGDPELFRRVAPSRQPVLKWAAYTCSSFMTGAIAGLVVAGMSMNADDGTTLAIATFLAALVAETADLFFSLLTGRIRRVGTSPRDAISVALTSFLVHAPVGALVVLAYVYVSPWAVVFLLVPFLAVQRLYAMYQRERQLAGNLASANESLARSNLSFAAGLVATLDARDRYTAGHSAAVAVYSRDIAAQMGLAQSDMEFLYLAGLVHDIGKVGLRAGVLEKPGPLTPEEREHMEEHSRIGAEILLKVEGYEELSQVVRHHHERIDGHGYPDGIAGENIPQFARIIAVADAYNAMTSDRPYRKALDFAIARRQLIEGMEKQFDPAVVTAFVAVLSREDDDYRFARSAEFRFFESAEQRREREAFAAPAAAAA